MSACVNVAACAKAIPKCELHLHLDGSLSPEFIAKSASARGITLPVAKSQLREYLHNIKSKQISKGNRVGERSNWNVFDFCNQFLQTAGELRDATFDLLKRMSDENVRLCELRFCPTLHCLEGMNEREVVLAVVEGFNLAISKFGMMGGLILCGLRSYSGSETTRIAELAAELMKETGGMVLGFDIAGDEGSYPISNHIESLRRAHELGVPVTVHAGEWPVNEQFGTTSLDNLKEVLQCGFVRRVGHGIMLVGDEDLLRNISSRNPNVCFECCLTANVGWKIRSYAEHPVKEMISAGANIALSCDNLLLSGAADRAPTPCGEIAHFLCDVNGTSQDDLRNVIMNSARHSFVFDAQGWSEEKRRQWLEIFEEEVSSALLLFQ